MCTSWSYRATGVCGKILKKYALEGFTVEGCRRRKRYSTSLKSTCNGNQTSCQESRQLCSFFISSDKNAVGKGTIDPFATEIDGKPVAEGCLLVRFTQTRDLEDNIFILSIFCLNWLSNKGDQHIACGLVGPLLSGHEQVLRELRCSETMGKQLVLGF